MRLRPIERAGTATVRAGFTLMELLVVVAILLVLTSVAVPLYMSYLERSKGGTAKSYASILAGELKNFYVVNGGNYPPENDWSMLSSLTINPPLDPWGSPYQWALTPAPSGEFAIPVVWSVGPNGDQGPQGEYSSLR